MLLMTIEGGNGHLTWMLALKSRQSLDPTCAIPSPMLIRGQLLGHVL